MSEQPPQLDATFFAFKKRDRRFVLTAASIAYFIVIALITAAFFALTWQHWTAFVSWYFEVLGSLSSGVGPKAPPSDAAFGILPFYGVVLPISFLVFAAFEAACLRWLVRGEAGGGLFGLRLDADTWRVFAVYWLWLAYFFAAFVAIAIFYVGVAVLARLGGAAQFVAILIGALAPIGIGALFIWGGVVFAPAAATSVGRRKLTFWTARKVSRPRYWPLLTSFFLVFVGFLIVSTIISTILQIPLNNAMTPITMAMMNGGSGREAVQLLQEVFQSPLMIGLMTANMVVSLVLGIVLYIALFGVNARAVEAAVQAGEIALD